MDIEAIALISHNPNVSRAVDVLVGGPSAEYDCSMRTGELIGLQLDPSDPIGSAKQIAHFRLKK
jgi:phosphohistidine phosphatase SixA